MNVLLRCALFLLCLGAARPVRAQDPGPITEEHVREVVSWLASDERQGRDSPSPGLRAAADYIAQHFAAAKLSPATEGSWLHHYTLPGMRLDSRAVTLAVTVKEGDKVARVELKADEDVRLLRAGEAQSGKDEEATVAYAGDPRVERMLNAGGGRRPVLLEVPADHPTWIVAAGAREVLSPRLHGARPVFLVRKGALPPVAAAEDAGFTATWSVAGAEAVDVELDNVVGVLRGAAKPEEYVLVSAHYDHLGVGNPVDGDATYNGADDDASGTTAVVLLAEALAKEPPPARSIAFVCFSAEEKGLRGSTAFAEDPPLPLDAVVADVNIEMIGRPEPGKQKQAWITGREYSDFAAIAAPALQRAGIQLVDFGMAKMLFAASDNWSLVKKGVVAHSISAGSLHADYHRPSDEVEKLDLPHMTAVIKGLKEFVRELADRESRPAYNEDGQKMLEQLRGRGR